jgi:hypothetical protein
MRALSACQGQILKPSASHRKNRDRRAMGFGATLPHKRLFAFSVQS